MMEARWADPVVRMKKYRTYSENLIGRDHLAGPGVHGRRILKWVLKWEMDWPEFNWLRIWSSDVLL